jgi:hypothetical protein
MISRAEYILLLLLFIGVIVFSMGTSISGYIPYRKQTLFTNEYPYENFTSALTPGSVSDKPVDLSSEFTTQLRDNATRVNGYSGLLSTAYGTDAPIDPFSSSSGSLTCNGSGYSNSQGALCISPENMKLLTTRGGNSTGQTSGNLFSN